jgi:hypothetical protein
MIPAGRGGGQYPDDITVTGTVAFKLFKVKFIRVRRGSRDQPQCQCSSHDVRGLHTARGTGPGPVHPDIRVSHDSRVVSGGRRGPGGGETMTPAADWMMRLP